MYVSHYYLFFIKEQAQYFQSHWMINSAANTELTMASSKITWVSF